MTNPKIDNLLCPEVVIDISGMGLPASRYPQLMGRAKRIEKMSVPDERIAKRIENIKADLAKNISDTERKSREEGLSLLLELQAYRAKAGVPRAWEVSGPGYERLFYDAGSASRMHYSNPGSELTPLYTHEYAEAVAPYAAALRMIREAIGEIFGPIASLESPDATLLRGPEPHHEAEAQIAALQRVWAAARKFKIG